MPKVSVIIPIYGVEQYIERCARSLFEQTLIDIEYIFVNDCTCDNSMQVLEQVIEKYPHRKSQIKIIEHRTNKGLPQARKSGVQVATGEYIAHCDSDDWVAHDIYETLYMAAMEKKYDVVFHDIFISDGKVNEVIHRDINTKDPQSLLLKVLQKVCWNVWGAIVNSRIYKDNPIIYPEANCGEDFALMFQLIHYSKSYLYIDKPLYYYFNNLNSITRLKSVDDSLKRHLQNVTNVKLLETFIRKVNYIEEYKDEMILLKLYTRLSISSICVEDKYRKVWLDTFPEIEMQHIAFNNLIPFKWKVNYYIVRCNVVKYALRIRDFIRKHRIK